ncbi:MAG: hypothetical protein DRG33_01240 [Deltaproteobacteria bacterium]|nr:MAG: hypothetical protein DRG33_01240 [Deltaproteobacteria bacterium]HEX16485.1 hypothetical protein [Deltaproteobacteria bacterium]
MARCLRCGNTTRFNVWCSIQKVLEVELNEEEEVVEIIGEPEDEGLQQLEDIHLMEDDLAFSMVSCAVCGSREIELEGEEEILPLRVRQ